MALKKNNVNFPKRGEIYWVDLEPTRGSETKKTLPGLVISNDIGNELSKVVIIAPITSKTSKVYPTEVKTTVAKKAAKIMVQQCRAIDKSRLLGKVGEISSHALTEVERALAIVFGLAW